jgi:glycosyltransferase involved in cell wall biosynthesis
MDNFSASHPPLITTIIPTYRRPHLLKRAIKSVLEQSFPHFRLCIYDNASGDETKEIVAEFTKNDRRVNYHCHEKNLGSNANFQYGLKQVTTPFFSFLSDDDMLLPNFYETTLKGFEKHPEIAFCGGMTILCDHKKILDFMPRMDVEERCFSPPHGLFDFFEKKFPNWTAILFKSEILKQVGFLNTDIIPIDYDFLMRIIARYPVLISNHPCSVFFHHNQSISHVNYLEAMWPGMFQVIENVIAQKEIPLALKPELQKFMMGKLNEWLFAAGISFIREKRFEEAQKASKILSEYFEEKSKAKILSYAAKTCEKSHLMHWLLRLALKSRKILKSGFKKNPEMVKYKALAHSFFN